MENNPTARVLIAPQPDRHLSMFIHSIGLQSAIHPFSIFYPRFSILQINPKWN
jgi:hypothetical protein